MNTKPLRPGSESLQQSPEQPITSRFGAIGGSISWKNTLGLSLAATTLCSVASNVSEVAPGFTLLEWDGTPAATSTHLVPGAPYEVPGDIRRETSSGPGRTIDQLQPYAREFDPAELSAEAKQEIKDYVQELVTLRSQESGGSIRSIRLEITGRASDEDGTDSSDPDRNLGKPSPNDQSLALKRGQLVEAVVTAEVERLGYTGGIEVSEVAGEERILPPADVERIREVARRYQKTPYQLLDDYNSDAGARYLTPEEKAYLTDKIDNQRGAEITSTVERDMTPVIGSCDVVVREMLTPDRLETVSHPATPAGKVRWMPLILPAGRFERRKYNGSKAQSSSKVNSEGVAPRRAAPGFAAVSLPPRRAASEGSPADTSGVSEAGAASTVTKGVGRSSATPVKQPGCRAQSSTERLAANYRRERAATNLSSLLLVPLVLVIPWAKSESMSANNEPPVSDACQTVSIEQGRRDTSYWTTVGQLLYRELFKPSYNPWTESSTTLTNTAITRTKVAHNKIYVDGNGNIISTVEVPAKDTVTLVKPVF